MITFSLFEVLTLGLLSYLCFVTSVYTGLHLYQEYLMRKQTKKLTNLIFTQPSQANLPSVHTPATTVPADQAHAGYGMYR